MDNIIVINVGGSLLSPSEDVLFDFEYAQKLKNLIQSSPEQKFILCVGGGAITRKYQQLLMSKGATTDSQHEVGVALINVNAVLLKSVLSEMSEEKILRYEDFQDESPISFNKQVLIAAAGAVGHSSDWNTIQLAIRAGQTKVFSLTNIDGVYNKDPKKFPDAEMLKTVKWNEYLDIIGNPKEHVPGAKYPVDPLAAELGKKNNIEFYVIAGSDLDNFSNALRASEFKGSIIK